METLKETRKAKILRILNDSRTHLRMAAECRAKGATFDAELYIDAARAALDYAQALMADAPASTRRRWKHSAKINARKRVARTLNAAGSSMQRHGRNGMRPIYVNI